MQVPAHFEYEKATSVEHALALLAQWGEEARVVNSPELRDFVVERVSPTLEDAVLDEGLGIIEKSLAEIAHVTRPPREAAAAAR